jgi:hypothetical protein
MLSALASLRAVKLLHTLAWAFFAGCVLVIPVCAARGEFKCALILIALVSIEVVVIGVNNWRCPLTAVAARFTDNRRDNFDIYLPLWLARYNKMIFGTLFVAGAFFTLARWQGWMK